MAADNQAYLLDVTRLSGRIGGAALTGIDRVELAYLSYFLGLDRPIYGLLRTAYGFLLLNRAGCAALQGYAMGQALPKPKVWARLLGGGRGALALRPLAIARRPHIALGALLAQIGGPARYFNVGHSNLSSRVFAATAGAGMSSTVLIHDTIPLDYPHLSRPKAVAAFETKIKAAALGADLAVHVSADARRKTEAHFARHGRVPRGITAHIGVQTAQPDFAAAPHINRPYFVMIGTLEPRKNHKLILDIWQKMGQGPQVPHLVIIGNNSWAGSIIYDQLAHLSQIGTATHFQGLGDGAVSALLHGAAGLLFPTLAEGFGLPPIEAASLGTPVIVSDLPVLRETCTTFAVYLDPSDSYSWMETILSLVQRAGQRSEEKLKAPLWADHFKAVLTAPH